MRTQTLFIIGISFLLNASSALAMEQPHTAIESLRADLEAMRSEYESRVLALEQRLTEAEQQLSRNQAEVTAAQSPVMAGGGVETVARRGGGAVGENVFNPAIGVIFQGQAWDYRRGPDSVSVPGFPLGGEAGPVDKGLSIGETEIDISANIDDKFTAWLTLPVVIEDGESIVEIEEAWIETQALPAGLAARFGRMFSGIGYLNSKHAHSWDFADQPLAYQAMLGDQYLDDGVQLRWLAPTDIYLELGGEILRGGRYPAAGAEDAGFGSRTLFARAGGDVGDSSWLAGLSYLNADSNERESGDPDDPLLFSGDSELLIAELVWKWAPRGNWKEKNFVFQTEYLWRREDGDMQLPDGRLLNYDADQHGWYAQAVYQPFPRWRVGARFDLLSADNPGAAFAGTELDPMGHDPKRFSLMADWSNSEFSRLRFQYTRDESGLTSDDQWGVQYIMSIGAHGAHTF